MGVRQPDLAGSWYPATESECIRMFKEFERSAVLPQEGDWLGGMLIPQPEMWEAVKSGKIQAFSIKGIGKRTKL